MSVENKRFGSENYESIKIRWDVDYQNVRYYNIYRATTFDYPIEYDSLSYTFVATKQHIYNNFYPFDDDYTDESEELKNIGFDRTVIYKVEPVGRYGVSPRCGTAYTIGLKAPASFDIALSKYNADDFYSRYTYKLSWTAQESYSSGRECCIFHYESSGAVLSDEYVKERFKNNPDSYQIGSVSFGTTTYDVSFSDTTSMQLAHVCGILDKAMCTL